jgi:hypothetical protein
MSSHSEKTPVSRALTEARQERIELVAAMRLWPGPESVPLPGYVTSRQAAERLGVTRRTVERYRAVLRAGMLP